MLRFFNPISTIELLALIITSVLLFKDKKLFWRSNWAYLMLVCFTEMGIGKYVTIKYHNNLWVYNIFIVFEAIFVSYGIYHCIKRYKKPKLLIGLGSIIILATYLIFVLHFGILILNELTINVMSVIFVIYSLYYYYLFLTDKEIPEIKGNPEFWWVTATLFYYFGGTTINLFDNLFSYIKFGVYPLRYIIYIVLNIILYGLWAYSFLCRAKQRKLQS